MAEASVLEVTISEGRDRFSSIIADIESGKFDSCIIKRRNTPVATITPLPDYKDVSKRFGLLKDEPLLVDDDAFDAMDAEIAEMFGVLE